MSKSEAKKDAMLPSLGSEQVENLSHHQPHPIRYTEKTNRLFTKLVDYIECPTGSLKFNQVQKNKDGSDIIITAEAQDGEHHTPRVIGADYVRFESKEIRLQVFEKRLVIPKQHEMMFREDFNPTHEQIRIAQIMMSEDLENRLINHKHFGLKALMDKRLVVEASSKRRGPCTDYIDQAIAMGGWKNLNETIILAHPKAVSAIAMEMTKDGSLMPRLVRNGHVFASYRGVPIVPSQHVPVKRDKSGRELSDIFVVRTTCKNLGGYSRLGATPKRSAYPGDVFVEELTKNDAGQREFHLSYYAAAYLQADDAIARIKNVQVNLTPNVG